MSNLINRVMVGFLALFVVGVAAVFAYQVYYVIPARNCESSGRWWDPESRTCAAPVYIPHITGRPATPQEAAAAAAAALPEAQQRSPQSQPDPRPAF